MRISNCLTLLLFACLCFTGTLASFAQQTQFQRFSGKVTDCYGKALRTVNIYIPGIGRGTLTDMDGNFTIEAKDKETLYFSHVGMAETRLQLDKNKTSNLIIQMQPRTKRHGEITVRRTVDIVYPDTEPFEDDRYIFCLVEDQAVFPGKEEELERFLDRNLQYPEEAYQKRQEGQVTVEFTISRNGNVENARVTTSVSPALDEEALRVVRSMPQWKPAMQRGRPVESQQSIPINFVIEMISVFTE